MEKKLLQEQKINQEVQNGILPVTEKDRVWRFWDAAWVNIGFAIATWCFMTGATTAMLVDFKTAIFVILAGNIIGVGILCIGTVICTTKYGIDQYTATIPFTGKNGMKFVVASFLIAQIGWVSVLSCMFGKSVQTLYDTFTGSESGNGVFVICALIAVFVSWLIVAKGPIVMKTFNKIVVPALSFVMIVIAFALFRHYDPQTLMAMEPLAPIGDDHVNLMLALEMNIAGALSWWPNMGGISRLTNSTRTAYWVNIIGIGLSCALAVILGAAAAFAVGGTDPASWMIPLGGMVLGVISLIFVALANLTSNSVVMYAVCLGLRQFKFFAKKSWTTVTLIFAAPCFVLVLFPDVVYGSYMLLLTACSLFFTPLMAMGFVDYFIFRKQKYDLRAIYNTSADSPYYYWGGINWVAVTVFISSIAIYIIVLNPFTWSYSPVFLYTTATGATALFAGVIYYILGKIFLVPRNIGDFEYHKQYREYVLSMNRNAGI